MQTMYKLYGTATSSTDAVAQLDIQKAGSIQVVMLDFGVIGADALDDGGVVEISFASVSGFATNDTRSAIISLRHHQGFLTTGGGPTGKSMVIPNLDIPVGAGERLWMHIQVSGTATIRAHCFLFVDDGVGFKGNTRR